MLPDVSFVHSQTNTVHAVVAEEAGIDIDERSLEFHSETPRAEL